MNAPIVPLRPDYAAAHNLETATRAGEFATLAKSILANGGFSSAAAEVRGCKDNLLPPKLADIIKTGAGGIFREPLQQKAAVGAGTLALA